MKNDREANINYPDATNQSNVEVEKRNANYMVDQASLKVNVKVPHSPVEQPVYKSGKEGNASLVDKSTLILNSEERCRPANQLLSTLKREEHVDQSTLILNSEERCRPANQLLSTLKREEHVDQSTLILNSEERCRPANQLLSTLKREEHVDQSTLMLKIKEEGSPVDQLPPILTIEEHGSPVDHGWAWAIMMGAFSNITLATTYLRASSLLFILFLDKYQESATKTAMVWMFGTVLFTFSNIVGPAVLFQRFKVRTLTITGAFINSVSIFAIAFAPNIYVIYLMMACLGFSHGLIVVPQMTLIGHYFHKRLGIATAFVSSGLSVATIASPPFTQFLLDKYGLQGTIIVLAGISMNCIPASMLFRPFSLTENNKHAFQQENIINDYSLDQASKKNDQKVYDQSDLKGGHEKRSLIRSVSEEPSSRLQRSNEKYHDDLFTKLSRNDHTSHSDIKTGLTKENESMVSTLLDDSSLPGNETYMSDSNLSSADSFQEEDNKYPKYGSTMEGFYLNEYSRTTDAEQSCKRQLSTTSTKDRHRELGSKQTSLTKVRSWVSQSIYFQPLAILILLASAFGSHMQSIIAYMPSAGKENGLTNEQVPLLVTVLGVADLLTKIAVGFIADLGYIKRIHIVLISEVICGTVVQFVRFFQGFGLMIALQIIIGTTMSSMHTFLAVIIVDHLAAEYIGHIMSGFLVVNGVVLSLDHVIAGYLKDVTGSFMAGYHYIGIILLFSALLLLCEPFVAKYKSVTT